MTFPHEAPRRVRETHNPSECVGASHAPYGRIAGHERGTGGVFSPDQAMDSGVAAFTAFPNSSSEGLMSVSLLRRIVGITRLPLLRPAM